MKNAYGQEIKEVKLNDSYYARIDIDPTAGGKTEITVLRENDGGYDFFCQNRVVTYTHVNAHTPPAEGEPGYDPWYQSNEEKEEWESYMEPQEVEKCKVLLENSGIIEKAREETLETSSKRNDAIKNGTFEKRKSGADLIEEAKLNRFDVHREVKLQEARERDIYGGMTKREWEDSL